MVTFLAPSPAASPLVRKPVTRRRICLFGAVPAVVLILGLGWFLDQGKRAAEVRRANAQVAQGVQAARQLLADREWDQAIDRLRAALATDRATALDEARALLQQAQEAQAESLLEAGAAAVEKENLGRAIALLQTYLAHPQAAQRARAAMLLVEAGRRGKAAEIRRAEEQRRDAQQERLGRLPTTPVFRELQEFVGRVRQQVQRHRALREKADQQLLASLLQGQKGVAQDALRQRQDGKEAAGLVAAWKDALEEQISTRRANFKERFRHYPDFEKADWEPFDRLVDKELDQLLEEVNKPIGDNVAEGLRALTGK